MKVGKNSQIFRFNTVSPSQPRPPNIHRLLHSVFHPCESVFIRGEKISASWVRGKPPSNAPHQPQLINNALPCPRVLPDGRAKLRLSLVRGTTGRERLGRSLAIPIHIGFCTASFIRANPCSSVANLRFIRGKLHPVRFMGGAQAKFRANGRSQPKTPAPRPCPDSGSHAERPRGSWPNPPDSVRSSRCPKPPPPGPSAP